MGKMRDSREIAHGVGEATLEDKFRGECGKQIWPWALAVICEIIFGGLGIGIQTHKFGTEYWGRGLGYGSLIAVVAFLLIWGIKRAIDWSAFRNRHHGR